MTAIPLVLAFSEFDDSKEAWEKYDQVSFRDLCVKLGVGRKMYFEAFESMILTGLFAPGAECSAAAALGMGTLVLDDRLKANLPECPQHESLQLIFSSYRVKMLSM